VRNPVFEPTPPALSPRARAEEELAVALACGSLRVVERLETEALDPKLDQQERLRASRVLLEAAAASRRVERARIIPADKQRATVKGTPVITGRVNLPPRGLPVDPPG